MEVLENNGGLKKKVLLVILDGWGIGNKSKSDAIYHANTPTMDNLRIQYPSSKLKACGLDVGLPEGQMGNSEVGHLNIGAGRIVDQDLVRINTAISNQSFQTIVKFQETLEYAKTSGKALHIMGLVSEGGVHSSQEHLYYICKQAHLAKCPKVYIHAFTDGRDTDPQSGKDYIEKLLKFIEPYDNVKLVSIIGRYYAMDRDKRWGRIKLAYDLLTEGKGEYTKFPIAAIENSYAKGVTDEFLRPISITDEKGTTFGKIEESDAVICFNFRTDRCRQITEVLTQNDKEDFGMKKISLHYVTMCNYDENFRNIHVIFDKENLKMTLGEVIANKGLNQLRCSETEKYPHVTFFFSGGREEKFEGEVRILVNSPKVATYDLQPEMSASEVTEKIRNELNRKKQDFICLNYPNPDMVGHTGNYPAIIQAVETIDSFVSEIIDCAQNNGYTSLIIADHGNADYVTNEDGSPNTAHSLNLVPCILVTNDSVTLRDGRLADVAPTILDILDIEKPLEMTGESLIKKQK